MIQIQVFHGYALGGVGAKVTAMRDAQKAANAFLETVQKDDQQIHIISTSINTDTTFHEGEYFHEVYITMVVKMVLYFITS